MYSSSIFLLAHYYPYYDYHYDSHISSCDCQHIHYHSYFLCHYHHRYHLNVITTPL